MKKLLLLIFILSFSFTSYANPFSAPPEIALPEYDNRYCRDKVELEKWQGIIENHASNDDVHGLHALWIGLCMKVELRQITVNRANEIFERARTDVVKSFPKDVKSVL